jgi:hypothetical protein
MKSINNTFANKNILTKLLVFHGLNSLDHEFKYSSNQKKEELLEQKLLKYIYKEQPELKEKIDLFLKENIEKPSFLNLFLNEFENKFKIKSIAYPLLMYSKKPGIDNNNRKLIYKSVVDDTPDFFIELKTILLNEKDNDFFKKDYVLFDVFCESLKNKKIAEFKLNEKDILEVVSIYRGENEEIFTKIFKILIKKLDKKNYDEKFYVNFFKDICIDNEEFNVFFNKKMEEEFGEEYKKISTYKKDESGIIKEGVYSKLHISYKFYVQEYEISQHGALSIVNEMTYAIKRALTSYSEIKEEDYDMFNTSSSLFFLTEDISLKNSIDKYFKLSVDMFQSKLISNSKFNDIVESIRKNETELEKILDFIFLDNSLINNESVKKIKKNKI